MGPKLLRFIQYGHPRRRALPVSRRVTANVSRSPFGAYLQGAKCLARVFREHRRRLSNGCKSFLSGYFTFRLSSPTSRDGDSQFRERRFVVLPDFSIGSLWDAFRYRVYGQRNVVRISQWCFVDVRFLLAFGWGPFRFRRLGVSIDLVCAVVFVFDWVTVGDVCEICRTVGGVSYFCWEWGVRPFLLILCLRVGGRGSRSAIWAG